MAKHTPKLPPLTRAGQDLRERQVLAARGGKGGWKNRTQSVTLTAGRAEEQQSRVETAKRRPAPTSATETGIAEQAAPRFTFPPPVEPAAPPPLPAAGTYRIDQLRLGQCRFACTPFEARSHRFCGARTEIGPGNLHGSWCAEHLPVVLSSGGAGWKSRAEVAAEAAKGVVA